MHLARLHLSFLQALLEALTPEQSRHAGRMATFIYKQLRRTLNALHGTKLPYAGRYLQTLRELWVPNDGRYRFAIPQELQYAGMPAMAAITANGQNPHVKVFQKPGERQRYAVVLIDVKDVEEARSLREVGEAIQEILYHVVHEPVHVHNFPAKSLAPTPSGAEEKPLEGVPLIQTRQALERATASGRVSPRELANLRRNYELQQNLYLTTPWEVEAYGRQLAMFYHRRHPFAPFDQQRFLAAINAWTKQHPQARSVNHVADLYFGKFRHPAYQQFKDTRGRQPFRDATKYFDDVIATEVQRLLG
jgi:hypothetical protein